MNTPTPRTDAATYTADCLGQTLVTNRDLARALEREGSLAMAACTHHNDQQRAACPVCLVATLTAERDQLRAEIALDEELQAATEMGLKTAIGRAEKAEAELATERARLDWFHEAAADSIWVTNQDIRTAIDAGMQEDAK